MWLGKNELETDECVLTANAFLANIYIEYRENEAWCYLYVVNYKVF